MSEQRLAAEVKFNLSKENIFVSVCLIYTLRLSLVSGTVENFGRDFQFGSAEREEKYFVQEKSF